MMQQNIFQLLELIINKLFTKKTFSPNNDGYDDSYYIHPYDPSMTSDSAPGSTLAEMEWTMWEGRGGKGRGEKQ